MDYLESLFIDMQNSRPKRLDKFLQWSEAISSRCCTSKNQNSQRPCSVSTVLELRAMEALRKL
ncbi:MAG: hypothetical protein GX195_00935 [Firmicutes bacterium]|nr:hypothetical protein [Bacillota bacterium]